MKTSKLKFFVVSVSLLLALGLTKWITNPWFMPVTLRTTCTQPDFSVISRSTASLEEYQECLNQTAKLFLEKDYAETKDLAKTFLTLISAVLVASITFSEKIVDIHNAKRTPLFAMLSCWLLMLLAIIFAGSGLASMTFAAGYAAYHPIANFWKLELHAVNLFIIGCLSFGFALFSLIMAGAVSLYDKRSSAIRATSTASNDTDTIAFETNKN